MEGANVKAVDAVVRFKARLVKVLQELGASASEANSEVERSKVWLEREIPIYWQSERRKRSEAVASCKSALYRKGMVTSSKDQKPSVIDEKKALQRAIASLEEAETKLANIKRWRVAFEREAILYRGAMSPFTQAIDFDLPTAVAVLNRMAEALERYLQTALPDLTSLIPPPALPGSERGSAAGAPPAVETTRRTGGGADSLEPPPEQNDPTATSPESSS